VTDVYAAIEAIAASDEPATAAVCTVLQVSRSAYYAWRHRDRSRHDRRDAELRALIRASFWKHRRRYGARRLAEELADLGERCSPRRVARLLKNQGLHAIQPKSFKPKTTDSRHRPGCSPNLLPEMPPVDSIDQLWVGDITYVPLRGGTFCYLAMLMDRHSRDIVGWSLDESMTDQLTLTALRMAIHARQPASNLVHHTDRGGQYASARYRAVLRRAGMGQSMNRPDNCYDNAFMESCFGTLKTELEMTDYQDYREARREIDEYIDYYRNDRKHSSLGYLTPTQFQQLSCPRP
jgi:putative transposase